MSLHFEHSERRHMKKVFAGIMGFAALALFSESVLAADPGPWIGTWEMSPVGLPTVTKLGANPVPPPTKNKGTSRYRLRIPQGGSRIRLRFSNGFSDIPLALKAATVGLAGEGLDALPGSLRRATF